MLKAIVTTTINPPTEALRRFREMDGWDLIVVGDRKTPHEAYAGWNYLSPEVQHSRYPRLSTLIGWNCIQRRNIGIVEAYRDGAEIIALVDDDNIPYAHWGQGLLVGRQIEALRYSTEADVFDPLQATRYKHLWHRGYPIPMLPDRAVSDPIHDTIIPDVQADLWDGDPDIDAIARIAFHPEVKLRYLRPFFSGKISPFNSQNTFLGRRIIPDYFLYPGIGRFDDIWAAYHVQRVAGAKVIYAAASVYQQRNPHDLTVDLANELYGYQHTTAFLRGDQVLPEPSLAAFREYRRALGVVR